jgi:hypothetical protein
LKRYTIAFTGITITIFTTANMKFIGEPINMIAIATKGNTKASAIKALMKLLWIVAYALTTSFSEVVYFCIILP